MGWVGELPQMIAEAHQLKNRHRERGDVIMRRELLDASPPPHPSCAGHEGVCEAFQAEGSDGPAAVSRDVGEVLHRQHAQPFQLRLGNVLAPC